MSLKYAEHLADHMFIDGWYIDETVCDSILNWREEQEQAGNWFTGRVGSAKVVPEHKDSIDTLLPVDGYHSDIYFNELLKVFDCYREKWPACDKYSAFGPLERTVVQKYNPGQGFHGWHTERTSGSGLVSRRHLVFMTYLNDVTDGGETEWLYQNLKVKPEKGLTVIWPADWTFTHRGITSETQTKIIVTGWAHYVDNMIDEQWARHTT